MNTERLLKAMKSGKFTQDQLLEIAAKEQPSGPLRDLLLRAAEELRAGEAALKNL